MFSLLYIISSPAQAANIDCSAFTIDRFQREPIVQIKYHGMPLTRSEIAENLNQCIQSGFFENLSSKDSHYVEPNVCSVDSFEAFEATYSGLTMGYCSDFNDSLLE